MFTLWQQRRLKKFYREYFTTANKIKILTVLSTLLLFFVVSGILLATILFAWYAKDLPRPDKVRRIEGYSTIIFDRNGEVLYDVFADQHRIPVELSEIPEHLKHATIAIEDKDFYKHQGFDLRGILRAVKNIILYRSLQGGSTLTQQLVKNVLLTQERTLPRKIKEFILAVQIEKKYKKDEILQMYLNEAPFGGTAWGVESAAQMYFGKHVKDLNLVESAILAGLPQKPTTYSPFGSNPKAYIWRTEQVLRRMREDGYITLKQEKEAIKQLANVKFAPQGQDIKAPHFVMYVKQQLVDLFGERVVESGGLRVTTTLDLKLQKTAEKIVKEEVERMKGYKVGNGAVLVMDTKTGQILAMVGSKDYFAKDYDGNFNVVTQGLRQPGSAIKPVTYATALKKGYTAATLLMDTKTIFPMAGQKDYIPQNYDGKFHGPMQVRYALGNSINVTAVKMLAMVGLKEMLSLAYEMGIKTFEPTADNLRRFGLSITLGGGEVRLIDLTSAYCAFSNGGYKIEPVSILEVKDANKKLLYKDKPLRGKRVISEAIAFIISDILSDNSAREMTFGRVNYLQIPGFTVAAKTGTTDDKRDNWTIGWTPSYIVGAWVGNNDNSPMGQLVSGVSGAAPIWNRVIKEVLKGKKDEKFSKPSDVISAEVDTLCGGTPRDELPKRKEYFIAGTEPNRQADCFKKLKISKSTGKLANDLEIAAGDYEEKEFIVFFEKDYVSEDGRNRWQEGIEEFINSVEPYKSDGKYHPPKEISEGKKSEVVVKIKSPENQQKIDSHEVLISAEAVSTKEIVKITLEIDGVEKNSWMNKEFSERYTLDTGPHKIKVKAQDSAGNTGEKEIKIGVMVPWDYQAPTPIPTAEPTAVSPVPTITLSPPTATPTPP